MTMYKEILKGIDSIAFPKRINKSAIAIIKKFCRYTLSVLLNATSEFYVSMCTYYHYLITTIWLLVDTEKLLIREIRIKSHNIYLIFYRPQRSWGKVIFSQASVVLSRGGGIPACIAGGIPACLAAGGCYPSMHCRWYPSMPCSRGVPASRRVPGLGGSDLGGVCLVETPPDGHCCGW